MFHPLRLYLSFWLMSVPTSSVRPAVCLSVSFSWSICHSCGYLSSCFFRYFFFVANTWERQNQMEQNFKKQNKTATTQTRRRKKITKLFALRKLFVVLSFMCFLFSFLLTIVHYGMCSNQLRIKKVNCIFFDIWRNQTFIQKFKHYGICIPLTTLVLQGGTVLSFVCNTPNGEKLDPMYSDLTW